MLKFPKLQQRAPDFSSGHLAVGPGETVANMACMRISLILLLLLTACSGGNDPAPSPAASPEVLRLRELATEILRRPELELSSVTLQHIEIAVRLEGRAGGRPSLTMQEAELLAASVLKQAEAGEDFDKLVQVHTYGRIDTGARPGIVTLLKGTLPPELGPTTFARTQFSENMWMAAWRLAPGEIGVVEFNRVGSDTSYYLLRRLTDAEIAADDPLNAAPTNDAVAAMRREAAELLARQELDVSSVRVQHILVGRYGTAGGRLPYLKPADAEAMAAEVLAQARASNDFGKVVAERSYDFHETTGEPGLYRLHREPGPNMPRDEFRRDDMVEHFWKAAWRLQPGEIGIVLYNRAHSPFGYHIIKRID